jgi:molybdopterin converting factor small subunit
MLIRVRLFGDLKYYVKKRWTTIDIPSGSSIQDLMSEFSNIIELDLLEKTMRKDKVRTGIRILVNGRNITHLQGLMTKLKGHDLVSFLPIAGGG